MGLEMCVAGEGGVVFSPSPLFPLSRALSRALSLSLCRSKPIGCCQRVIGCEGSSSCTNALHSGETGKEGGREGERGKLKREKASKRCCVLAFSLRSAPRTAVPASISRSDLFNCIPEGLCVRQLAFGHKGSAGKCGRALKVEIGNRGKRTKGEI